MSIQTIPIIISYSTNLVVYIVGGIFGFALVILIFLFLLKSYKRKSQNNGQAIEEAINPKISARSLKRLTLNAYREEKYQHAVIYLYYQFRIFCEEKLTIRRARNLPSKNLTSLVAGTPNISLIDVRKFSEIYDIARFSKKEIDKKKCDKAQRLLKSIMDNYH